MPTPHQPPPFPPVTHIGADDLSTALQTRLGLVLGPGVTHSATCFPDLSAHLAQLFSVPPGDSFLQTADTVLDNGTSSTDLLSAVSAFFAAPPTPPAASPRRHPKMGSRPILQP